MSMERFGLISLGDSSGGGGAGGRYVRAGTITLSTTWEGEEPYSQAVEVEGTTITAFSKIDLTPSPEQASALIAAGVESMMAMNDNGAVTVWCFGGSPAAEMEIQCIVQEVQEQ